MEDWSILAISKSSSKPIHLPLTGYILIDFKTFNFKIKTALNFMVNGKAL